MDDISFKDIPFNPGDKVIVKSGWFELHPESPLTGICTVCEPGYHTRHRERGEVPFELDDDVWYVPVEYVEAVDNS